MHPDLEKLKSLQEIDREIQRLNDEIATLPKRVALIEAKLASSRAELEKHKAGIKQAESARRNFESEIQSQQQKISKYREQSLEVKTNEQYKALMHEVEFAEKNIREQEEKILQAMLDNEAHEKAQKAAEVELKIETAEIEKEKIEAHTRTEQDQKELAEWNARRSAVRREITPAVLAHYDRVLPARKTALAEALAQKCSACNVMLRPQKYDEIRSNQQIITCDSCSRILFYDPAHEPAPPPPPAAKRKRKTKATEAAVENELAEPQTTSEIVAELEDEKISVS